MVFKLVRTDAEEANKIQLPLGTHLIGRGKFLDCDDKRISRNHGHLIVTEDSVALEALHQNPCFFTKKGSDETQVLKKSSKETLVNGDRFGLLPGSYWYEVLYCITGTDVDSQATDLSNSQELEPRETVTTNETQDNDKTLSGANIDPTLDASNDELVNFDLNETVENAGRAESPSLLDQQNEPQNDSANQSMEAAPSSPSANTVKTEPPEPNLNTTDTTNQTDPPAAPPEPNVNTTDQTDPPVNPEESKSPKRSHSPDDDVVKRIKTEPVDVKQELLVKQEPDDGQAGTSGDGANQAGASNSDNNNKAPPGPAQPQPPRERCIYGADCYRAPATAVQLDRLVDYMSANPSFASEYITYRFAPNSEAHWERVKSLLAEFGPDRPVCFWKQTWKDLIRKAGDEARQARAIGSYGELLPNHGLGRQTTIILTTLGPVCVAGLPVPEIGLPPSHNDLISQRPPHQARPQPLSRAPRVRPALPRARARAPAPVPAPRPAPRRRPEQMLDEGFHRLYVQQMRAFRDIVNSQRVTNRLLRIIASLAREAMANTKMPRSRTVYKLRGPMFKF